MVTRHRDKWLHTFYAAYRLFAKKSLFCPFKGKTKGRFCAELWFCYKKVVLQNRAIVLQKFDDNKRIDEVAAMHSTILYLTSVTYAVRGQKLLFQHGIRTNITKKTGNLQSYGCGYGLEVFSNAQQAIQILTDAGIRIVEIAGGMS